MAKRSAAKDISKKIRSTFKSKGDSGKHVASSPPYGFIKDPNEKNHWIVDEEAAEIVRRMFRLTLEGNNTFSMSISEDNSEVESENPGLLYFLLDYDVT